MNEIIHDVVTGKISERELTATEVADSQAAKAIAQAEQAEREAEAAAKQAARQAVFTKLGLTAEEAAALIA